jgi:multidrug transporter EmrE-like cation transporter
MVESAGNLIGGLLAVLAAFVSVFGMNIQKLSHTQIQNMPEQDRPSYISMPLWWLGMSLVVFGALADFTALGMASQSLVAALGGGSTLVANVIIARFWQKEKLKALDIAGVSCIIAGAVMISIVSPHAESYSLEEIVAFSRAPSFIFFCVIIVCIVLVLMMSIANSEFYKLRKRMTDSFLRPLVRRIDKMSRREEDMIKRMREVETKYTWLEKRVEQAFWLRGREKDLGLAPLTLMEKHITSAADSVVRMRHSVESRSNSLQAPMDMMMDDEEDGKQYLSWVDAFTYASVSGTIGAMSVLLAGCCSKILIAAIEGNNQFNQPQPYFYIMGMICTLVLQTKYLNAALQLGEIMTVFPVFQAFWISFGVIGGIIFYQQGSHLSDVAIILHILAAIFMVVGCVLLMKHGKEEWMVIKRRIIGNKFGQFNSTGPRRTSMSPKKRSKQHDREGSMALELEHGEQSDEEKGFGIRLEKKGNVKVVPDFTEAALPVAVPAPTPSPTSGGKKKRKKKKSAVSTFGAAALDRTNKPKCVYIERDDLTVTHLRTDEFGERVQGIGLVQGSIEWTSAAAKDAAGTYANSAGGSGSGGFCGYFEVEVLDTGDDGCIAIGLAPPTYSRELLPGWGLGSVAFHGDDGKFYFEKDQDAGEPVAKSLVKGDVVGCGFDFPAEVVFFTLNGVRLLPQPGQPWAEGAWTSVNDSLVPTVGMGCEDRKGGEAVLLNFGGDSTRPFKYKLEAHKHISSPPR